MRNRILTFLTVALVATLPLAGAPLPTAQALTDPMYGAPTAGQCYNMAGSAVIGSPYATAPTVPCSGPHTVLITAVVQVPATMTYSGDAFNRFVTKSCLPPRVRASGGLPLRYGRSSYAGYDFMPTTTQQDQGAHWVTCMMGIAQGSTVRRITGPYPHLSLKPPAQLTLCLRSDFSATNCAATHTWHPVSSTKVTSTVSNIRAKAYAVCRNRFGTSRDWAYYWKMIQPMSMFVVTCFRR